MLAGVASAAGMDDWDVDVMHDLGLKQRSARDYGDDGNFDLGVNFVIIGFIGRMKEVAPGATWSCPDLGESLCCGSAKQSTLDRASENGRCRSALGLTGMPWNIPRPTGTVSVAPGRRASSARRGATKRPRANLRSALKRLILRDGKD